ncbi:J domain-containing protein [Pseudomonas asplenii]|uniref:J domain-containing protein n=1 Tax=Pseudomonas asplenii TaxID=53407 RepID=UPI0002F6F2A4|nr:J domain-containing protein [Pseudomonas fuscovaginae]
MDCWSILQLTEDADQRSIKRSYARLLKTTRPDEDAEAFQQLREAYEQALEIARWRDEDDDAEAPRDIVVAAPAERDRPASTGLLDTQPAAQLAMGRAQALVAGLTEQNLPQRWEQARQQDCAEAFQQTLLRLCFEQPGLRNTITAWAVQQLEWLTPWQAVVMTPSQEEALSNGLLQEYRQGLQDLLEAGQEREFVNRLKDYGEQPWLKVFDRRREWQPIILQLLHETRWSLPLFDRVCQLFDWDERKGNTPEPEWTWRALIERCEQEGFYQQQLAKAHRGYPWSADQLAAQLLLTPLTSKQQMALYQRFEAAEWQACQQLAETLAYQYPALLERLPEPDVFFWWKFTPRPVPSNSWSWLWAASALTLLLHFLPQLMHKVLRNDPIWITLFLAGTWALIPVWAGRFLMPRWLTLCSKFFVMDAQLSQRLLPQRINPNGYWLVLRHGVPQAILGLCFWTALGALGLATFVGVGLIGLLDQRRRGAEKPASGWKQPLQAILHWTHWSPLQLGFFVIMLAVTVTCIFAYPGFPLTRPT